MGIDYKINKVDAKLNNDIQNTNMYNIDYEY